jgi:hypothetical protein
LEAWRISHCLFSRDAIFGEYGSGKRKLDLLNNDRCPGLAWTTVEEALREADNDKVKVKSI